MVSNTVEQNSVVMAAVIRAVALPCNHVIVSGGDEGIAFFVWSWGTRLFWC